MQTSEGPARLSQGGGALVCTVVSSYFCSYIILGSGVVIHPFSSSSWLYLVLQQVLSLTKALKSNKLVYHSCLSPSFESLSSSYPEGKNSGPDTQPKAQHRDMGGTPAQAPLRIIIVILRQPMPFVPCGRSGEEDCSMAGQARNRVPPYIYFTLCLSDDRGCKTISKMKISWALRLVPAK